MYDSTRCRTVINGGLRIVDCRFGLSTVNHRRRKSVRHVDRRRLLVLKSDATIVYDEAPFDVTLTWIIDGASEAGAVETRGTKTLTWATPGARAIALSLVVRGLVHQAFQPFLDLYGMDIHVDFAGVARPQGRAYDIGAVEAAE